MAKQPERVIDVSVEEYNFVRWYWSIDWRTRSAQEGWDAWKQYAAIIGDPTGSKREAFAIHAQMQRTLTAAAS